MATWCLTGLRSGNLTRPQTQRNASAKGSGTEAAPKYATMVEIIRITRQALQDAFDSLPPRARVNAVTESFALGSGVVRAFLGNEWVERHVIPNARKSGFLTIDESDPQRLDLSCFRIIDLAEVLYNLQNISGFDACIEKMRNGDIEGTCAELDFGRMLYLNRVTFRYVVAKGTKGEDYDVQIIYPDGVIACADAKCKIDSTETVSYTHLTLPTILRV